ncbi:fungal-specific transcription factor domain-domain-containing protein [Syncephalastrum racemosum]|uniref:Fungal-specific transcription factor domain-domain-containing protein n=1 Tax=Syncephalastrum racemosum TaxID=13706 RepID=A0A1X2H1X3_SYNRA|nr:fungal-specific transcription factor domain-domain-containing protein [Syncephalastrum racemosum]
MADQSDELFATHTPPENTTATTQTQPTTRPDKMMEQLTEGLVRLTFQQDSSQMGDDSVSPWRNYGDFVRWTVEPTLPSHYTGTLDMPMRQVQEHLIHVFFMHCHHILPALSRSMFFDQLSIKGPLITPLLLNIMYAHAAKHVDDVSFRTDRDNRATQGHVFYNRARRLVDDFLDVPRVSTVIALLYMASYDFDEGQSRSRAWMYSGMAVRMCLDLGLHTANYSSQMTQFDVELRKRVLWTCYVMDKLESCVSERPWMLRMRDIGLDFPAPLPEDDAQERYMLEGFAQLCRLMIIMEKIIHFFAYDTKNSVWTVEEENQTLRFLEEIEQWRASLPPSLAWHRSQTPFAPASAIVANLHLVCYDLELSLVMCCRYQDDQLHRDRRRSLANAITHLVSLTVQQPRLMYAFTLSAFSGIFAALTHAADFDHPTLADEARMQFRKCLEDIRAIVERVPVRDMRNLSRLVDLTLQPAMPSNQPFSYAHAFSAISGLCHKDQEALFATSASPFDASKAFAPSTVVSSAPFSPTPLPISSSSINGHRPTALPFAFDMNATSMPTTSAAAAAKAAAAAAVGAVGTPTPGSSKSIEPADYTFELISVADEWSRTLM